MRIALSVSVCSLLKELSANLLTPEVSTQKPLPKRCQNAYDEIAKGKQAEPELTQIPITKEHTLYRCLEQSDIDPANAELTLPGKYTKHDLSFYAVGPHLPHLEIDQIIAIKPEYIAAAELSVKFFYDHPSFNLNVVHDPYRDPIGHQHPNHVRVICSKGMEVGKAMMREARIIRP